MQTYENPQPTKKHYVDNNLFRIELIKSNAQKKLTNPAIEMLMLMISNIQTPFHYQNNADKEDCRSSAIEVVLRNWESYDVTRQNAFAYFTRMIYNGLYAGWNYINEKNKKTISFSNIFQESI